MIENDRQLFITQQALVKLEDGLATDERRGPGRNVAPEVYLAGLQALHSQIADLHSELADYYRTRLQRKLKL